MFAGDDKRVALPPNCDSYALRCGQIELLVGDGVVRVGLPVEVKALMKELQES
jgi:hypothetical protein